MNKIKITDVNFSKKRECPTFMMANIKPKFDIDYNLSRMEKIVREAHERDVDILIFPELSISGYIWDAKHKNETLKQLKLSDNYQPKVKKVLDRIRAELVNSGKGLKLIFFSNIRIDKCYNKMHDSTFVMSSNIDYNSTFYDKIFLTPLEKLFFDRGNDKRLVLETNWGKMGVMMCYDLCFVGLGKKYAFSDNVDVIITLAAWRKEAIRNYPLLGFKMDNYYQFIWGLMHSALAAHNQVWSIGTNYVGFFEKAESSFCGKSGIWSPSGIPLLQASDKREELVIIRNLDIQGHMRRQAKKYFDYGLDFDKTYEEIRDIKPKKVSI